MMIMHSGPVRRKDTCVTERQPLTRRVPCRLAAACQPRSRRCARAVSGLAIPVALAPLALGRRLALLRLLRRRSRLRRGLSTRSPLRRGRWRPRLYLRPDLRRSLR